jgi:FkbM family methyltransferase
MHPTTHTAAVRPREPLVRRVCSAIAERRLPYRIEKAVEPWLLKLGSIERTIRRGGLRFRVRRGRMDGWCVENIVAGEYNPPGFEVQPGDTVVDIGANVGAFSLHAARTAKRVIAIEAGSENVRLLMQNAALNWADNLTVIHAAVADYDGEARLSVGGHGVFNSICTNGENSETVAAIRLERIFDDHGIDCCDFLKCDCEGAEHQIFHSLPTGVFDRIGKIAMEWHGAENRDKRIAQGEALVDRLVANGFHIDAFTEFPSPFRGGMIFAHRL